MDLRLVTEAVRELRARNERVSVRAVHALTGGSFRDLTKLLRDATEFMSDDEVAALEAEAPEPPPPPPGQLVIAHKACQAAAQAVGEVQNLLDATQDRLRSLQRQRPASTTDPHLVSDVVAAQLNHEAEVLAVQREVEALQRILDGRRAEQAALKEDYRRLCERANQLRQYDVPILQRRIVEVRHELTVRERDAAHQIALARRRVEGAEHALAAAAAELVALIGD